MAPAGLWVDGSFILAFFTILGFTTSFFPLFYFLDLQKRIEEK